MKEPDEVEVRDALDAVFRDLKGVRESSEDSPGSFYGDPSPVLDRPRSELPPIVRYVRSFGREFMTTGEVAEVLQISTSYVRKLCEQNKVKAPSFKAPYGKDEIRVFTPEDVEEIKDYILNRRRGGLTPTHNDGKLQDTDDKEA